MNKKRFVMCGAGNCETLGSRPVYNLSFLNRMSEILYPLGQHDYGNEEIDFCFEAETIAKFPFLSGKTKELLSTSDDSSSVVAELWDQFSKKSRLWADFSLAEKDPSADHSVELTVEMVIVSFIKEKSVPRIHLFIEEFNALSMGQYRSVPFSAEAFADVVDDKDILNKFSTDQEVLSKEFTERFKGNKIYLNLYLEKKGEEGK